MDEERRQEPPLVLADERISPSPHNTGQGEAQASLGAVLSSIGDAVLVTDAGGKVTLLNPVAEQLTGWTTAEALGADSKIVFDILNEETRQAVESPVYRVLHDGIIVGPANHTILRRRDGSELPIDDSAAPIRNERGDLVGVVLVFRDISARRERERKEHFLADLAVRVRALLDPDEVLYQTAQAVGEFTGAHRCLYTEIDDAANTLTVRRDFVRADAGIPSMAGTYPLSAFGPPIVASLREGNITQIVDTETDPRLSPEHRATFRATHFRAFLAVPLHKAGRFVAVLAIHDAQPRIWTPEEVDLLTAVVERTWLAVENARLFRETHRRAEREALLNRIGAAVRSTRDADAILQSAVSTLGQGLGVDRCYFVRYDDARDTTRVFCEWYREDMALEPLVGRTFQMSAYELDRDPSLREGQTHVVDDVHVYSPEEAALLLSVNVSALIRVPITVGNHLTVLAVVMARRPHHWSADAVQLVENVGALVRSALESAQIQQRERNIAQQLQEALQPTAPTDLPGLSLASYYRPALAESNVGGDFYDVFAVTNGRTALVVADLSGKGLAAASQVSTVRNMLRYALYSHPTPAEAVTHLHCALVTHDVLAGFATLFVGIYDEPERSLTYVNCGQEPGLIWRAATRNVEQMPTTGPVLGGFGNGDFEQHIVGLSSGDVLALFTDGLTEVGPSRKQLLEVEGVSEVLRDCCAAASSAVRHPQSVVDCLIAGVNDFARGGLRDDIALLVGVVSERERCTGNRD